MNTASRKPSHTPTYESVKSSNSGCKSLDTTSYNPSAYKTSDATTYETINEKETSIFSILLSCMLILNLGQHLASPNLHNPLL